MGQAQKKVSSLGLEKIRRLLKVASTSKRESQVAEVEAFILLCELRDQEVLWMGEYPTWPALLRGEGVSQSRWDRFSKGFRALGSSAVKARHHGYFNVAALGALGVDEREMEAKRFDKEPARVVLASYRRARNQLPRFNRSRAELIQYIEKLEKTCRRHRIELPKKPW